MLTRLSRIEHRVTTEHASVVQFPRTSSNPILLVGDSLLLMDVDMNALNRTAPPGVHFQRFSIEQTFYLDWLFGLRRIFFEGVRPATVILCMAPNSFVSTAIRGDYTAYHLLGLRDIPMIAREAKYDLTMASSLFFAHYSLFYASRSGLRNFALTRAYPAYGNRLHDLLTRSAPLVSREDVLRISASRFQEMKELCATHGTHFIYLMPPGFDVREDAIVDAAARAHASLLVPVHSDGWPKSKFSDGFHLSEAGAREFTQILSPSLYALLRSREVKNSISAAKPGSKSVHRY